MNQEEFEQDITKQLTDDEALKYFSNIKPEATSTTQVEILPELKGKCINKIVLSYISSFKPDRLKIVSTSGETMEGKEGCVTIYTDKYGTIKKITFGITLILPDHDFDNIDCDGHIMECVLNGWKYK